MQSMAMRPSRLKWNAGIAILATAVCLACLPTAAQTKATASHAPTSIIARGELLGLVTDAAGRPQSGAIVQVRSDGVHNQTFHALTNADGVFQLLDLIPGIYYVQVGQGTRVATRQRVEVRASERALLLVDLPQILRSVQFGPPTQAPPDQQFSWALRQATIWRPILRLDDAPPAEDHADAPMSGYVALTAGSGDEAFAGPELSTDFRVDSRILGGERISLAGDVGTDSLSGGGDTHVQASFRPSSPDSAAQLVAAVRQITVPGMAALPNLRMVSLNYSDAVSPLPGMRAQFGMIMDAVSMTNTVSNFNPYARLTIQAGEHGEFDYRVVSAAPPMEFTRNSADLPDPTPKVTLNQGRLNLQTAWHQELAYTDTLTPNDTISLAAFDGRYFNTAVNGAYGVFGAGFSGADASFSGMLLPDLLNNMFVANGGGYSDLGYRIVYSRRISQNWSAAAAYSEGGALAPNGLNWSRSLASGLRPIEAGALTMRLSGSTPTTHTGVIASYKAVSRATVTALDAYDDGPAASDSFVNLYVRQPLPAWLGSGRHMDALVEVHNLLAQGYIPMLGSDGQTLYLVQVARSLRGGLSISF